MIEYIEESKRKPSGYWTFETCKQEALKHSRRSDFSKASYQAYDLARVNKWLDLICLHMTPIRNRKDYWTLEKCLEESLKYKLRVDFMKKSQTAYSKAVKNNWLEIVCKHMIKVNKPKGYWILDKCKEEALKYTNTKDFSKNNTTAYKTCVQNKWLDDVCTHMIRKNKWNFNNCKIEALNFTSLYDFRKASKNCYLAIHKNNWLTILCSHMIRLQESKEYWTKERCYNESKKYKTINQLRKNCSKVYSKIHREGWNIELFSHMESTKKSNNYWTYEKCQEEALKFDNQKDFRVGCQSGYVKARKNNWLENISTHFKINGSWYKRFIYACEFTDNRVYVGLTYNIEKRKRQHLLEGTVFEYSKKSGTDYCLRQLINEPVEVVEAKKLEKYYLDMYINSGWIAINKAKTGGIGSSIRKWDFKTLSLEALKYNSKKDFREHSASAYSTAKRLKIIDDICSHMARKKNLKKKF